MRDAEEQRLTDAAKLYEGGHLKEAVLEYRALAETLQDPLDKAEVLLYEVNCLIELGELSPAKEKLRQLYQIISTSREALADTENHSRELCLAVDAKHSEAALYQAEDNRKQTLAKLDELLAKYPKHLRTNEHRLLFKKVQVRRAVLLVELGRCAEARPILEEAISYDLERSCVLYYLGRCYYVLGKTDLARDTLLEALQLGLPPLLEYEARHTLGLAYYKLAAYARAKQEFELCSKTADPEFIAQTRLWEWLAATCKQLGLDTEAEHYTRLSKA